MFLQWKQLWLYLPNVLNILLSNKMVFWSSPFLAKLTKQTKMNKKPNGCSCKAHKSRKLSATRENKLNISFAVNLHLSLKAAFQLGHIYIIDQKNWALCPFGFIVLCNTRTNSFTFMTASCWQAMHAFWRWWAHIRMVGWKWHCTKVGLHPEKAIPGPSNVIFQALSQIDSSHKKADKTIYSVEYT